MYLEREESEFIIQVSGMRNSDLTFVDEKVTVALIFTINLKAYMLVLTNGF